MSEKKLNDILLILNKYINNYYNCDFIDYYGLFEIDRNSDLDEINNRINKLKRKLHSDLTMYLPENFRSYYTELLLEFSEFEKIFTNQILKNKYDDELLKVESDSKEFSFKEDDDITEFEFDSVLNAIKATTMKHGFNFTFSSIENTFLKESRCKWETRFSRGTRENISEIGLKRFKEIIRKFSRNASSLQENIIDWFSYLYKHDEEINSLIVPLEKACYFTLAKYGKENLQYALQKYYNNDDAAGFTRVNESRKQLRERVKSEELPLYIAIYLNSFKEENEIYGYEKTSQLNFDDILTIFMDKFMEEINDNKKCFC